MKGLKGLEESVARYFGDEELTGENQYECETCDQKVDAKKCCRASRLPPILTFSLNRFAFTQYYERYKLNDCFEFPLELDLAPFLHPDSE